jgi:penicillin-binding protein 1A
MTTYNRYQSGGRSRTPAPAPNGAGRRRRRNGHSHAKKWLIVALCVLALLFVALVSAGAGAVIAVTRDLPLLDQLSNPKLKLTTIIYDRNGQVIAQLHGVQNRFIVKSGQIPDLMKQATVAKEDQRFYAHHGIDFQGLIRALIEDIKAGHVVQGGSTITEQYVKNTYLSNEQSVTRKIREAALAWQLEDKWSKDRILTAYLNTVYYGNGAYGVQAAAQTYFHKNVWQLRLPEAALLAALPKFPTEYSPIAHPEIAKQQRNLVLGLMQQQGYISTRELLKAQNSKLVFHQNPPPAFSGPAAYFVEYVVKALTNTYGTAQVFGGGLRVYTTIDMKAQNDGINTVKKYLGQPGQPASALVSVDPQTGYIRTMVGGLDYAKQKINWATQAQRQAGSAMKPFTLVAAVEMGANPATTYYTSKPLSIDMPGAVPPVWIVHTYSNTYAGRMNLVQATLASDNTVFAQLMMDVGPAKVVDVAHRMGIKSPLEAVYSLVLGSQSVNPLEMASAYATLADGGIYHKPQAITKVTTADGKVDWAATTKGTRAISEGVAYTVTQILKANITSGTGYPTRAYFTRPAGGKTGTTDNHVDAWFCGFTPNLSTVVWMGYPENNLHPMLSIPVWGGPIAGATVCAPMWGYFMAKAVADLHLPSIDFPYPSSMPVFKPWTGHWSLSATSPSTSPSPKPKPTVTMTIKPTPTPTKTSTPTPTPTKTSTPTPTPTKTP